MVIAELNYYEELFSVRNKIVLVTGASRGIGFELATNFCKAEAHVIGIGRTEKIKSNNFDYISADITKRNDLINVGETISSKHDKLNIIVNSAGISSSPLINDNNYDFDKILKTNLTAVYECCVTMLDYIKDGGSIINITSIASYFGFPENPGYISSKGGLSALTRSLAFDLSRRKIRVNNIVPGYIQTSMTSDSFNDIDLRKQRESRMLINRWGQVGDLVGAAIFLASDASSYITGADIVVDGGWSIKGL